MFQQLLPIVAFPQKPLSLRCYLYSLILSILSHDFQCPSSRFSTRDACVPSFSPLYEIYPLNLILHSIFNLSHSLIVTIEIKFSEFALFIPFIP